MNNPFKNMQFGFAQWQKSSPAIIDSIYHTYLFAWSVWLLIAGSKYITVPDHTVLIATWISGLTLPLIYSFCRCFGCPVPTDIPAENSVPVSDPKIQAAIDKMDSLSASVAKFVNTPVTLQEGTDPLAVKHSAQAHVVTPAVQNAFNYIQALVSCKSIVELAAFIPTIPADVMGSPGFNDAINLKREELEKLASL